MTDWQPIETMPMREVVLVLTEDGVAMAKQFFRYVTIRGWDYEYSLCEGSLGYPKVWMPIPEGPKP